MGVGFTILVRLGAGAGAGAVAGARAGTGLGSTIGAPLQGVPSGAPGHMGGIQDWIITELRSSERLIGRALPLRLRH